LAKIRGRAGTNPMKTLDMMKSDERGLAKEEK
jgi:hypothetical protein